MTLGALGSARDGSCRTPGPRTVRVGHEISSPVRGGDTQTAVGYAESLASFDRHRKWSDWELLVCRKLRPAQHLVIDERAHHQGARDSSADQGQMYPVACTDPPAAAVHLHERAIDEARAENRRQIDNGEPRGALGRERECVVHRSVNRCALRIRRGWLSEPEHARTAPVRIRVNDGAHAARVLHNPRLIAARSRVAGGGLHLKPLTGADEDDDGAWAIGLTIASRSSDPVEPGLREPGCESQFAAYSRPPAEPVADDRVEVRDHRVAGEQQPRCASPEVLWRRPKAHAEAPAKPLVRASQLDAPAPPRTEAHTRRRHRPARSDSDPV